MWDTAVLDWEQRLLSGASLVPTLPLYPDERDKALRVFNRLRLPDVIGQPRMGDAMRPWFKDIVGALFGSYDAETHRRMIQEVFLLVPKKNSKSTGAAGIMVTALILNRRPGARFQLVAPTKTIAGIAYRQARGMIKADPALTKLFALKDHVKTIVHLASEAELTINAADADVITGSLVDGTLIDETHVFAQRANAADIFVEIRGALAARPDGFLIQITTQSKGVPTGVFKSELTTARDVCHGRLKLPTLAVLYELPEHLSKDWRNRRWWGRVNPNLGLSVDEEFLVNQLTKAEASDDPKKALSLLASQHFNVQIGQGLAFDRWAGANYWEGAAEPALTLDEIKRRCDVCTVGIDGGGLDDLLGVCVIGRDRETRRWLIWLKAWAQDDVLTSRPENTPKLIELETAKELVFCRKDRPTQDIEEIADLVEELNKAGLLPEKEAVGLDPQAISALVDELVSREIDEEQIVAIPQGYKLSGAVWGLERKLKDGTAKHCGQAIGAWTVGNAKTEQRGNAVLITKQTAGKAKIDPLCAAFNAVQLMGRNPAGKGKSFWETAGSDDAQAA